MYIQLRTNIIILHLFWMLDFNMLSFPNYREFDLVVNKSLENNKVLKENEFNDATYLGFNITSFLVN